MKILLPLIIIGQLTAILLIVQKDRAFQCKTVSPYLICRQIKIK